MKIVYGIAGASAAVGGLYAGGVLDRGQVYAKPFDQAYAELASMSLAPMAREAAGTSDIRVRRLPDSIEWHFRRGSDDIAVFTAHLSEQDAYHTRVKVDFDVGNALDPQSRTLIDSDYMRSTAKLALHEQVSAELEDRAFDINRFGQTLAAHASANPQELKQFGENIRGMFQANAEMIRANSDFSAGIRNDYRYQQYETRRQMEAATKPMTELPPN